MKKKTNWLPLFSTNFVGVLNDNFLKTLICFIAILWLPADNKSIILGLAAGLFVIPYVIFSQWAGKIAKENSKADIIRISKLIEIPIMLLACTGFLFSNVYIVMTALFLMGLQSCMYSPAKYGIIRDVGGKEGISFGTGAMEMLTFTGLLIGTFLAGIVSDIQKLESIGKFQNIILCGSLIIFAIVGWGTSTFIKAKESTPDNEEPFSINPVRFVIESMKWSKKIKGLNHTILSLSTFWLIGSMIQLNIIEHGQDYLKISDTTISMIMASVAIGIALGCIIVGIISKKKVVMSLVPIGGFGMGICLTLICLLQPDVKIFALLISLTAFFGGIFKIPLNSYMQDKVEGRKLGHILGYSNTMVFTFILISAAIFGLLGSIFDTNVIFIVISIITWGITILSFIKIPGAKISLKPKHSK